MGKGKMDFPELGDAIVKADHAKKLEEKILPKDRGYTGASMGAPTKGTATTSDASNNKFDRFVRMAKEEEVKGGPPKERPRYGGALKKNLGNQKELNTDADKDNDQFA
jgi:hypothetical protein